VAKTTCGKGEYCFYIHDDRFALRFTGLLLVPESGQWTFTLGSDDSSWLWIDDALVVENAKVAPHRRKSGKVTLAAGSHRVRIVFTEIGGQESLEFLWRGPSGAEELVPASALARRSTTLTPRNASVAKAVVDGQDFENKMLKAYIRDWPDSDGKQEKEAPSL
jgi:hypothetical protein